MARTTLTTTVQIQGQDGLSGLLSSIATKTESLNRRLHAIGTQAVSRLNGALALGGVSMSLDQLTQKAQEFNKYMFGIGVAQIPDYVNKTTRAFDLRGLQEAEAEARKLTMELSKQFGMAPAKVGAVNEALIKAGRTSKELRDMASAALSVALTDPTTGAEKIAEYLDTVARVQNIPQGVSFGDWMKKEADKIYYAAARTKLSAGGIIEAQRQWASVAAFKGMSTSEQYAAVMAGAQAGLLPTEMGTAYKSNVLRLDRRTAEGNAVLARYGINISDAKYSEGAALVEAQRALTNLDRSLAQFGKLDPKTKNHIRQVLAKRAAENAAVDPVIDEITAIVKGSKDLSVPNDVKGAGTMRNITAGAITTGTGSISLIEVVKDLALKGAKAADWNALFEGRHAARNHPLIKAITNGEFFKYQAELEGLTGENLDHIRDYYKSTPYGKVESMRAAMDRMWVNIGSSDSIQKLVSLIENLTEKFNELGPAIHDAASKGLIFLALSGPALLAAQALRMVGGAAWLALRGFGALSALNFAATAAGLKWVAGALGTTGLAGAAATGLGGLAMIARGLAFVARWTGIGAAIWGAVEAYRHWDEITAAVGKVGETEAGKALAQSWANLKTSAGELAGTLGELANKFAEVMGWNVGGGDFAGWVEWMVGLLTKLTNALTTVVNAINEFLGTDFGALFRNNYGNKDLNPVTPWDSQAPQPPGTLGTMDQLKEWYRQWFGTTAPQASPGTGPGIFDSLTGTLQGWWEKIKADGTAYRPDPNAPQGMWRSSPFGNNERPTVTIDPSTNLKASIDQPVPVSLTTTGEVTVRALPGTEVVSNGARIGTPAGASKPAQPDLGGIKR